MGPQALCSQAYQEPPCSLDSMFPIKARDRLRLGIGLSLSLGLWLGMGLGLKAKNTYFQY